MWALLALRGVPGLLRHILILDEGVPPHGGRDGPGDGEH